MLSLVNQSCSLCNADAQCAPLQNNYIYFSCAHCTEYIISSTAQERIKYNQNWKDALSERAQLLEDEYMLKISCPDSPNDPDVVDNKLALVTEHILRSFFDFK
ncbi:hypothetical protein [Aeromonas sanarellii]